MTLSAPSESATAATKTVRAWDLPTRVFHWTLVSLVVFAWASFEFSERLADPTLFWHRMNGYAILTLVVWRLLWGLVGSSTSRFSAFVQAPHRALGYGVALLRGTSPHYLGHNPLGAYMILALLAVLAAQAGLGLVSEEHNQTTWGPLYFLVPEALRPRVTKLHGQLFHYGILVLVAAHVTANVLYGLVKKDPLIRAMITGSKPALGPRDGYADQPELAPRRNTLLAALACLVIAASLVLGTVLALGGKLFY